MSSNILYVYDRNEEGEKVLLGAEIHELGENNNYKKKAIYVGIPFILEDIDNEITRRLLKVKNKKLFAERYNSVNAQGIVYFPQTDNYAFLEEGESVVLWNGEHRVQSILEKALVDYNAEKTCDTYKANVNKIKKRIASLDADDPLVELYGGFSRHRVSSR